MSHRHGTTAGTAEDHHYSWWRSVFRWRPRCRCGQPWPCLATVAVVAAWPENATELARRLTSAAPAPDEPDRFRDLPRLME